MTIWWVPSLWHSVTPPLKNPGYAYALSTHPIRKFRLLLPHQHDTTFSPVTKHFILTTLNMVGFLLRTCNLTRHDFTCHVVLPSQIVHNANSEEVMFSCNHAQHVFRFWCCEVNLYFSVNLRQTTCSFKYKPVELFIEAWIIRWDFLRLTMRTWDYKTIITICNGN